MKKLLLILIILLLPTILFAATPVLNFSDLTSGPNTGNTDGIGSGTIVTIWGNNLGSTKGTSKVYVGGVEATAIYYWKNADGALPGGPSNLYTYHKMQEIAFAIPSGAPSGNTTIKVTVNGTDSNTLPFTVRTGNIYFIKSTGNDSTGNGSWSNPWKTIQAVVNGGAASKITPGDIVYSVGVGASNATTTSLDAVRIGLAAPLQGTLATPFSLSVYPNTTALIDSQAGNKTGFRNYGVTPSSDGNTYWNFSKWTFNTGYQASSIFGYMRFIGNNITGIMPSTQSYSGIVGGNCDPVTTSLSTLNCSGAKVYGNEVHEYGDRAGTNVSHHLIYISNRSGKEAEAYEIGWNYMHDNYAYQGIHIYDTSQGSPWTGVFKVHDNVIKNQAGNAINVDNGSKATYEIYNNLTILDNDWNPVNAGTSAPKAALRLNVYSSGNSIKVYNNTFYGYAEANTVSTGVLEYRNNIMIDTRNLAYTGSITASHAQSNNLFYSVANPSRSKPTWATGALSVDPKFTSVSTYDFTLLGDSLALNAGYDVTSLVAKDILGNYRDSTPSIGAFDIIGTPPVINGACGVSSGSTVETEPISGLCNSGAPTSITWNSGLNRWSWFCNGINNGENDSCYATKKIVIKPYTAAILKLGPNGRMSGTLK
jgi:uncharacterized protein (TIGR03437 family)